ncbi:hypothetical protein PAESOLCIP111_04752 [Paenibacillus solanacearum]|uniref:Uncharacterized protein n=1 Tax=Paenibacillus solanacearum TaxID=2048548 RepID=A0A916NYF6_9BACL|nr:hypothetical protein [Paenibacillus solanacearum]CAG7644632.1 hypothetical protein PAESOLCIP111_04752 [Paenibacillus solanacearum]
MNMRKISHWVVVILGLGITLQMGLEVYSGFPKPTFLGSTTSDSANPGSTDTSGAVNTATRASTAETTLSGITATTAANQPAPTSEIVISQEVLDRIRQSDPANSDRNIANYKNLLIKRDVHPKFKEEVERLVLLNHRISDLLIAYEFLYQAYGQKQDLEAFVRQKEAGKAWDIIFQEYKSSHEEFRPRTFDSGELESLMAIAGITSDDIMIADRVSFVTAVPFKDLIKGKLESSKSWKEANAGLDIVNSAGALPRVQISAEQINRYTQTAKLSEQQVAEAFVLATKVDEKPEIVIEKLRTGVSQETIMSEYWQQKYNG